MRAAGWLMLVLLCGCRVGGGSLEAENDRLRRERHELLEEMAVLRAERDELRAKTRELVLLHRSDFDLQVLDAIPRVASIEIDGLSGLVPAQPGVDVRAVRVHVRPLDGRRRFTQAVGVLTVSCELIPPPGLDVPARTVARTLSPAELRDAYRSGIAGTHYTVELPLSVPASDRRGTLLLRAELRDALTGTLHQAHLARDLTRP